MALQNMREAVSATPYAAQFCVLNQVVADTAHLNSTTFDIGVSLTDVNQLTSADSIGVACAGPICDAYLLSDGAGTVEVILALTATDVGLHALLTTPLTVVANTPFVIAGLRIPAQAFRLRYTNTSGGPATTSFAVWVRSN